MVIVVNNSANIALNTSGVPNTSSAPIAPNTSSASSVDGSMEYSGLDLETILLIVQTLRVNMMDKIIQSQLKEIETRNKQISIFHDLQNALNKVLGEFPKPEGTISTLINKLAAERKKELQKSRRYTDYEITIELGKFRKEQEDKFLKEINDLLKKVGYTDTVNKDTTHATFQALVQKVKNDIDKLSNSQQMDMVRLQGMSGKRNEAFEVMTNFIKKLQDSRSGILNNMR